MPSEPRIFSNLFEANCLCQADPYINAAILSGVGSEKSRILIDNTEDMVGIALLSFH